MQFSHIVWKHLHIKQNIRHLTYSIIFLFFHQRKTSIIQTFLSQQQWHWNSPFYIKWDCSPIRWANPWIITVLMFVFYFEKHFVCCNIIKFLISTGKYVIRLKMSFLCCTAGKLRMNLETKGTPQASNQNF